MPFTKLDEKFAIVTIDLQKGILGMLLPETLKRIMDNAARLVAAFRARQLPVVLVNVAGVAPGRTDSPRFDPSSLLPDWIELADALGKLPQDHLVTKQRIGAFI